MHEQHPAEMSIAAPSPSRTLRYAQVPLRALGLAILAALMPGALPAHSGPGTTPLACGELQLGLAYLDEDQLRYGLYRGQGDGSYGVLSGQACGQRHPAEGGARWWHLLVDNAGLRNARVEAGIGEQGRWRVDAGQQRLRTARSDGSTPLQGVGSAQLTLPADWQAGPSTAAMPALQLPQLNPVRLGSERRTSHLGMQLILPENWQLQSQYREQRRHGLQRFAGMIGSTGGNARAIILPAPVDQRTQDLETALVFAGERLQVRLGTLFSQFDNRIDSLQWQNPYAAVGGWTASASHPLGRGQAQPAPDNRAGQISVNAAWRFSPTLQAGVDVAMGRMTQNQAFLPYSIDPLLLAAADSPLPRTSLNGRVDTHLLQLRLSGRPHAHWRWTVNLRDDQRDNRTPVNEYIYIPGDAVAQNSAENSGTRRFNLPYDLRSTSLRAQLGYRPSRRADLSARLDHSDVRRSISSRASSEETGLQLQLRSQVGDSASVGLRSSGSDRSGGSYIGNRSFLAGHATAYTDGVSGQFENLPELRQYHLADRRRYRNQLFATLNPLPQLSVGVDAGVSRDNYRASELGLQSTRILDTGVDVAWAFADSWTANGFARREYFDIAQRGRAFQGGANRPVQSVDPNRNWDLDHNDQVDSFGFALRRDSSQGRLGLYAELNHANARGQVELRAGPALTSAPLPASRSRLQQVNFGSEWRVDAHTRVGLNWRHERLRSSDWAWDDSAPNTLATVILLGEQSPNYRGNAVTLTLRRSF